MKTTQTIGTILTPLFLGLFLGAGQVVATATEAAAVDEASVQIYPYEKTFTITAYYSPVEGQQRYIRGSLAADKKLNGNGTNGADGTPVYPGMIAAPKTIPFGTKMRIPGIGTVAVHDRGGAIVPAGQRGQSYDRLDIWMGHGDEGLNRALRWGRRTVTVMVYGIDESIVESIDLSGISSAPTPTGGTTQTPPTVKKDYGYGDAGAEIIEIKGKLNELNYFTGTIDENFDNQLYRAIVDFQLANRIVDSENEFGAGYFGPQTRRTLEQVSTKRSSGENANSGGGGGLGIPKARAVDEDQYGQNVLLAGNGLSFLVTDLQPGSSGQAVVELQTELAKLHFFGLEPTGYYGEVTAHAVFKFQQSQGLVSDKNSVGAGIFGPQTRTQLSALVNNRIETRKTIASKPEEKELLASK